MQEAIFANARLVIPVRKNFIIKPAIDLRQAFRFAARLNSQFNIPKNTKIHLFIGKKFGQYTKDLLQLKLVL